MENNEIKKVWVTKYALTQGIFSMEGKVSKDTPSVVAQVNVKYPFVFALKGVDWHETLEEAVDQAEKMRLKKIKSLQKQIKKLENIKFVTVEE